MIRPGDRVFFEPAEEHWHGAAPNRFMTHIAMQELDEQGSPVTWGEHLGDEECGSAPPLRARHEPRPRCPTPPGCRLCPPVAQLL